jgi:hypothetical protein
MKKLVYIFIAASLFFILACDDNPVQTEAKEATISDLVNSAGFSWYYEERDKYVPDAEIVDKIKQEYNAETHDIYMFVKAACTCPGNHNYFPKVMKTLDEAGIQPGEYKIYTMTNEDNNHPYEEMIKINELPGFFIVKNTQPVYSILDSFLVDQLRDNELVFEEYILKGLEK